MDKVSKHNRVLLTGATLFLCAVILLLFPDLWIVTRFNQISTTLLALLTAAYVLFTYQILKTGRPQPNVFAHLPKVDQKIYLSIKNIGSRPAYKVEVEFKPHLDVLAPTKMHLGASTPMLRQPFMAPDSEIRNFITSTIQVIHLDHDKKDFAVSVQYSDSDGNEYSDSYRIDLSSYVFVNTPPDSSTKDDKF